MHTTSRFFAGVVVITALLLAIGPAPVQGWGYEGHKMILRIAIDLMAPGERSLLLEERNYDSLERNVLLPDRLAAMERNRGNEGSEGPNHYINTEDMPSKPSDYEGFYKAVQADNLKTGRLVSRILECTGWLERAGKKDNREEWLHWAAFLAHYVGDGHQPLHVTANHDGRHTGNPVDLQDPDGVSVHIRYESGLVNNYKQELESRARDLAALYLGTNGGLQAEAERFKADPRSYVCSFAWGAHEHVAKILDADNRITGRRANYSMKKGRYYERLYKELGELTAQQLARASIAAAAIWYNATHGGVLTNPDTVLKP
ncbi:MAG: hypothetical protein HY814_15315 [Candidatus Riflebacteria bacterium]|nr:hypothetical protein [Candidatus Riflebacteria bacterium]